VDALVALAPRRTPAAALAKGRLIQRLEGAVIGETRVLHRYHEALCYLQAYPDGPELLTLVDQALAGWGARTRGLSRHARARLADSGMAGTSLTYPFGFPMARWLAARAPRGVRIAWDPDQGEPLEETLSLLVTRAESEAFTEGGPGWRRWLELAARGRTLTALQVLVEVFERAPLDEPTRDWLFESLGLVLEWRLSATGPSRTHARLAPGLAPVSAIPPRPHARGSLASAARRGVPLRAAAPALAAAVVEAARVAMATRARELFAFSHPNPDDVLVADPEPGLRIALIGLPPAHRLPLDAYYAFLALRNGVPVGYGAGWYLLGTLELGFNVFESFRHGGSAQLVGHVLRAYRAAFRMRAVVVDRYQIGHENPEALRSGAFHFYRRLGFHPLDAETRRLARAEAQKIARRPGYRSPPPVLERLARSDLVLSLEKGGPPPRVRAGDLAGLVSERVSRSFAGDRAAAVRASIASLRPSLGLTPAQLASRGARRALETLGPVLALIPDLASWPQADRRGVADLVLAKAWRDERRYARLMDRHRRLRGALADLSASLER
jgi:hypothetical protein